nr:MAG: internal scaffolding protein [Microvirus sp.]
MTYNLRKNGTRIIGIQNEEDSLTDPSFASECNVNNIVKKFKNTGQITHLAKREGVYADVSTVTDLLTATIQVQKASEAFKTIPAELRRKLNEDPAQLIEFLNDPENDEEAIYYGLKERNYPQNDDKTTKKDSTSTDSKTVQDASKSDPSHDVKG